jgi:predicted DNA binding protein
LVELLRRYSNRIDLLNPLVSLLERINEELPASEEEPQLASTDGPSPQAWRVSDRLTPTDIKILVTSYLAGSTIRDLAQQYDISTTSVKRVLRAQGARKLRVRRAA